MTLLFAFLIGLFAGLRSLTPPAAVAWAVHLGWLNLVRPLSLIGSLPAVMILSLLAVAEIILDKLPNTPNRTAPVGLIARMQDQIYACECVEGLRTHESVSVGNNTEQLASVVTHCPPSPRPLLRYGSSLRRLA